jgi:hypothetical protein
MKQNTKDFLFVGAGILIALVFIIAVIIMATQVFHIANVVSGNG